MRKPLDFSFEQLLPNQTKLPRVPFKQAKAFSVTWEDVVATGDINARVWYTLLVLRSLWELPPEYQIRLIVLPMLLALTTSRVIELVHF